MGIAQYLPKTVREVVPPMGRAFLCEIDERLNVVLHGLSDQAPDAG
jgi:hypothetical protein